MKDFIIQRALLLGWILLGVMVFLGALKEQVVLGSSLRHGITMTFPQGWSFFTKSPRDEALLVYRVIDGKPEAMAINNHQNRAFGFGRSTRLVGYEASMVASKIHPSQWTSSTNEPVSNFVTDSVIVASRTPGFNHFVEGEYIFKLFKGVPFAWAGRDQEKNTPFRIARISIR